MEKYVLEAKKREIIGKQVKALRRMQLALDSYVVHGVETSIDLHKRILTHPAFLKGETYTNFIEVYKDDLLGTADGDGVPDEAFIAAALAEQLRSVRNAGSFGVQAERPTPWQTMGRWEIGGGG